ncbi:hypothetical protein ACHAXT_004679 [Thalassiosira profunda]
MAYATASRRCRSSTTRREGRRCIACVILLCVRACQAFVPTLGFIGTGRQLPSSSVAVCHAKKDTDGVAGDARKDTDGEAEPEWDGVVIEGAHDADFDSIDDSADAFVPSIGFMSMAQSVTSPALSAIGSGGNTSTEFDPLANAGILHRMTKDTDTISEDDLLDMGGDPAFLDVEVDAGEGTGPHEELDDSDFFWDGTVDEDAHMDFLD